MRAVWCKCAVSYSGRGDTTLVSYPRLILIKEDGSVGIHSDASVKPLNYMGAKSVFREETEPETGNLIWTFDSTKENLTITIEEVYSDHQVEMPTEDPGLIRDGTEKQLQDWLADNITVLGASLEFRKKEYRTQDGAVDLLAWDHANNEHVLIEVKRVAMSNAVYQVKKYLDDFDGPKRGMIVALDVRPKTRALADRRGIEWQEVAIS